MKINIKTGEILTSPRTYLEWNGEDDYDVVVIQKKLGLVPVVVREIQKRIKNIPPFRMPATKVASDEWEEYQLSVSTQHGLHWQSQSGDVKALPVGWYWSERNQSHKFINLTPHKFCVWVGAEYPQGSRGYIGGHLAEVFPSDPDGVYARLHEENKPAPSPSPLPIPASVKSFSAAFLLDGEETLPFPDAEPDTFLIVSGMMLPALAGRTDVFGRGEPHLSENGFVDGCVSLAVAPPAPSPKPISLSQTPYTPLPTFTPPGSRKQLNDSPF